MTTLDQATSYSAGVAYIVKEKGGALRLLLVLQRGGEKNTQKEGRTFVEKHAWKMPMGHFDASKDNDLIDTAKREFEEETGYAISREALETACVNSTRIPSLRPEAQFHEDHFFLVVSSELPKKASGAREDIIEAVAFFPLEKLPEGSEQESLGVPIAQGHRKKLAALIMKCGAEKLMK